MTKKKSRPTENQPEAPADPQSKPPCAEEASPSDGQPESLNVECEDKRDVEPAAVPAVEMMRTVVMLGCSNLGTLQPGEPIFVIAITTQDGIKLTVCHEKQLEIDLGKLHQLPTPDDSSYDGLPLGKYREMIWLMGPPTRPRVAIIGLALRDLGACNPDRKRSTIDVFRRILVAGPDHLDENTTKWLADVHNNIRTTSDASKNLAEPLLERMAYLSIQDLACLARNSGAYLTEKGMSIFHDWPDWKQSPAPPKPPKRELSPRRKLRKLDAASEPPAEQT